MPTLTRAFAAFLSTSLCAAISLVEKGQVRFAFDPQGVSALATTRDPFQALSTRADRPLGLVARYRGKGQAAWCDLKDVPRHLEPGSGKASVRFSQKGQGLHVVQDFRTDGKGLDWAIRLENRGGAPLTLGDLAIEIPVNGPWGEDPKAIFQGGFIRHAFISGHGSFLYFVRASGEGPFLLVTPRPGTKLEYSSGGRSGTLEFIHSGLSGARETRGTWRQPHTSLELEPGKSVEYGFRFQWADSYDALREGIFQGGLFDVRVVPGMTVPEDLPARFSLHTKARLDRIQCEFPAQTRLTELGGAGPGYRLYEVRFQRLGENKLTLHHDGGRTTQLEFFVTEPLETLIHKRAAFIAGRQQIRDGSTWWDGVYAPYDMRTRKLRTPEDPDIFTGRMSYVLTCDDPGLSKAPLLAQKNVSFPDAREIESLEYYLEHFVWGKLQRTDKETPYPYGVYGTPDWYTNRDEVRRKAYTDQNLDKMHVWRSYDYPHVVMLYFHMYEIARKYPALSKYLDAPGYLERAYQTARAFFTYPYEILPSFYETYKWGLYNELVVLELAKALDREGFPDRAAWLRAEWEKKVKYFVYDDPYPYRSEYAFDRTAFESTYAFAKYGATRDMAPDQNLWWDIQKKTWYSHPRVSRADSRAFMERQLMAGLCVRGWLEPTYFQLGSDPGMSYMAAMGGWGVLDYALNFSANPTTSDWIQLGYASYLSSWCLMNTGSAGTGYGFWFPGKENDGAAGWAFMTEKFGHAWMGAEIPRGPWPYDGEIDLGFCGALRMASTVLTRDPLFGWTAYGATLARNPGGMSLVPRDGLRQRFAGILPGPSPSEPVRRLRLELDRDGFAKEQPIAVNDGLDRVAFTVENRTGDTHTTQLRMAFPEGAKPAVFQDGAPVHLEPTGDWERPWSADLQMKAGSGIRVEVRKP